MKRVVNNIVDGDDMITKLHDDQLRQIINLLPTKDALRTSVLSSRWRYLSRCISNIDVDVSRFVSYHHKISFFESVDRLLVHHDSSDIKRFRFSSDVFANHTRALHWISEVIKHNVEELRITSGSYSYRPFTLPLCLLKSESLTVLEIDIAMNHNAINLGSESSLFSSVHLPSLKRLRLSGVVFINDVSTQHFFSNIPKLQRLCLCRCDWKKVNRLIIDIPTLESIDVAIKDMYTFKCQVTVIAPNLTSLKCDTDFSIEFLLVSNQSLSLKNVLLKTYFLGVKGRHVLPRFLECVKEATSLHMGWDSKLNQHLRQRNIAVEDLPLFMNLKHLEISAQNYHTICDVELEEIFMFLHKMPYLESFTIAVPDSNSRDWSKVGTPLWHLKDDWSKGGVPSCVINQIKNITIITCETLTSFLAAAKHEYFVPAAAPAKRDYSTAMNLIKYFMNHCRSLETLDIKWLCSSTRPSPNILDEIERHPRYSELKRFSCPPLIINKPRSMPFPWEDDMIGEVLFM